MAKKIHVILGSKSDKTAIQQGIDLMDKFGVEYKLDILSAHRNAEKLREVCQAMEKDGIEVVIACAGMAAALPGFIAAFVDIPVLGVAMKGGMMDGLDALFSMTSIPRGIGLASTGVGKSAFVNAVIFALSILSLKDKESRTQLKSIKKEFE
ncbi:MAG: AIR carboxylase family protein [Candidatus Omnitrophica bacterium]|nr:AIR carboxylase family protein [Candidatus Omnitrophota bacterium]